MSDVLVSDDLASEEACHRERVIRDLLELCPGRLSIEAVEDAAFELGLSRATTYRLIGRYRAARAVDVGSGKKLVGNHCPGMLTLISIGGRRLNG